MFLLIIQNGNTTLVFGTLFLFFFMQTIAICILHYANKEKFYSNINRFQIQSPPLSRNKVSNDYCIKTSYSAETVDSFDKKKWNDYNGFTGRSQ